MGVVVKERSIKLFHCRLELLKVLTENGKKVDYIEEIIGPFLLKWMPEVHSTGKYVHVLFYVSPCVTFTPSPSECQITFPY